MYGNGWVNYKGTSGTDAGGPARGWAGPGRPMNVSNDWPRLGPLHQVFISWATARPGLTTVHLTGRGPAHIFLE